MRLPSIQVQRYLTGHICTILDLARFQRGTTFKDPVLR
jgi:hypothetical protein